MPLGFHLCFQLFRHLSLQSRMHEYPRHLKQVQYTLNIREMVANFWWNLTDLQEYTLSHHLHVSTCWHCRTFACVFSATSMQIASFLKVWGRTGHPLRLSHAAQSHLFHQFCLLFLWATLGIEEHHLLSLPPQQSGCYIQVLKTCILQVSQCYLLHMLPFCCGLSFSMNDLYKTFSSFTSDLCR